MAAFPKYWGGSSLLLSFKIIKENLMWLFTSNSFVSVVADRDDTQSSRLLVRARIKGDIDQLFPNAEVMETPLADYRYRAWVDRQAVSNAFKKQVEGLTYTNFKNSVKDKERLRPLMNVWQAMFDHQETTVKIQKNRKDTNCVPL